MASDPNHSESYKVLYVMSTMYNTTHVVHVSVARPFTAFLTVDPVMCTRNRLGLNKLSICVILRVMNENDQSRYNL